MLWSPMHFGVLHSRALRFGSPGNSGELGSLMSVLARQFGRPRGILGRVVGHMMVRGNGDFNRWLVSQVRGLATNECERIVELGPGPGIGLQQALGAFPKAHLWGVDLSPEMLSQARRRNSEAVKAGRLALIRGDAGSLHQLAPVDLVFASHVLYFWHEPATEIARVHSALRPGGLLALGYQLRANMPAVSQKNFPKEGHVLYESDEQVSTLLKDAGFSDVRFVVKGDATAPEGRLALATA
jgi:SAM-dependent methyltransferase